MSYERELDFARRLATAAGDNAKHIREGDVFTETKADTSPVTIADKENERIVREAIEREFPDDGILGEEGSSKSGSSRRRWIVDPIDGTRDFVRGNRFWCVLIALEEADEPVVGVAHFPMLDETYWAVRGGVIRVGHLIPRHAEWRHPHLVHGTGRARREDPHAECRAGDGQSRRVPCEDQRVAEAVKEFRDAPGDLPEFSNPSTNQGRPESLRVWSTLIEWLRQRNVANYRPTLKQPLASSRWAAPFLFRPALRF
jgi:hypothetical protein